MNVIFYILFISDSEKAGKFPESLRMKGRSKESYMVTEDVFDYFLYLLHPNLDFIFLGEVF